MSAFFSYEERLHLQSYLKEGLSFKEISRRLGKDPSTISREVRKYSSEIATGYPGQAHNTCKNRKACNRRRICGQACSRRALYCKYCAIYAIKAVLTIPKKSVGPGFVLLTYAMVVQRLGKCSLVKNFYDAEKAHIRANETISESRSGLCVAEQEIFALIKSYLHWCNRDSLFIRFISTIRMNLCVVKRRCITTLMLVCLMSEIWICQER